jgi:trigger factor
LDAALTSSKVEIPKILVEQETDRLLSQLLDELKTLGVTLDQYLASRNKTGEQLRAEYAERAEKDLKLEFMLRKIADEEKITVEQADIEKALGEIKDEKQKKDVASNPYLVAAIIRQQKTLDFLSKL